MVVPDFWILQIHQHQASERGKQLLSQLNRADQEKQEIVATQGYTRLEELSHIGLPGRPLWPRQNFGFQDES